MENVSVATRLPFIKTPKDPESTICPAASLPAPIAAPASISQSALPTNIALNFKFPLLVPLFPRPSPPALRPHRALKVAGETPALPSNSHVTRYFGCARVHALASGFTPYRDGHVTGQAAFAQLTDPFTILQQRTLDFLLLAPPKQFVHRGIQKEYRRLRLRQQCSIFSLHKGSAP